MNTGPTAAKTAAPGGWLKIFKLAPGAWLHAIVKGNHCFAAGVLVARKDSRQG